MNTSLATRNTSLATPSGKGLIKFGDDFDAELLAEMQAETQLMARDFKPVVFTASAGGILSFTNKQTKKTVDGPLVGVILAAQPVRAFWAEKNGDKIPFCSSQDCLTGTVNWSVSEATLSAAAKAPLRFTHPAIPLYESEQSLPEHFDCIECPLNKFGSAYLKGDDAAGKACQERRLLLMLLDGWHAPVIVSLAPGSLGNWKTYYSEVVSASGIPYFAVRTSIELKAARSKGGNDYAQMALSMKGKLNGEEVADAKRLRSLYKPLIAPDTVIKDADYYMSDNGQEVQPEPPTDEEQDNPF